MKIRKKRKETNFSPSSVSWPFEFMRNAMWENSKLEIFSVKIQELINKCFALKKNDSFHTSVN